MREEMPGANGMEGCGKNRKIRCIALDLDKTTLNTRGSLSRENRKMLETAAEAGIEIVAASGRSLDSLPEEITGLQGLHYAITSNGAAVYDLVQGKCLRQFKMTPDSVDEILKLTAEQKVAYEAFIDGKPYAQKSYVDDPVSHGASTHAVVYIQTTRTPVEDMRGFIAEHRDELDCIDIVTGDEKLKTELWKTFEKQVTDVYITSSVPQLLEISHRDSGKENGAAFLLEYLGMTRENLAAFGDGDNDCGLLRFAKIGFAVANASDACRAAADRIVASNDENGVAEGIRQILEENDIATERRESLGISGN